MTREEAIKIFESTVFTNDFSPSTIRAKELNRISIEALKQPEIIYCKDCKYYSNNTEYCQKHNRWHCRRDNTIKSQNHYCSRAERKWDI